MSSIFRLIKNHNIKYHRATNMPIQSTKRKYTTEEKKSYTNNQAHDNAHGENVTSTSWKIMYTGIVLRVKINGEYKNGTRASEPNKLIEIEDSKEEEKKKI